MTNAKLEKKVSLLEEEIKLNANLWKRIVILLEENLEKLRNNPSDPIVRILKK